jgi:NAD(P)H-dependent flavin oxidoreductase YrpB (nitropropane dioxygenase family)
MLADVEGGAQYLAVELETGLCRRLGISLPILSAGMGAAAGPELAAAVSGAGGLGVLGLAGAEPDLIRGRLAQVRRMTRRPVGVNLIIDGVDTDEDRQYVRDEIVAAADGGATVVVLFWGDPAPYVATARRQGLLLLMQVGSVAEARAAVAVGVDVVIAQGVEAGGHVRGTTPVWELVPATVQAIAPTPVVASGGIGDGRGLARALRLGAQAVSFGTRFLATPEAYIHPEYKRRIVESSPADTFYGTLFDGGWPDAPHRVLRTRLVKDWEAAGRPAPGARPGEGDTIGTATRSNGETGPWARYSVGVPGPDFDGDIDDAPLWAGESCGDVHDIKPAAEVIADLVVDATSA